MKLHQRGDNYHLRIRVPSDLVSVMGRREIHQSLRTTDGRTARSRADQLKASLQSGFEKLRMARLSATSDDEMIRLANGLLSNLGSTRRIGGSIIKSKAPIRLRELMELHLAEKKPTLDPRSYDKMIYSYKLALHHIGNVPLREINRMVCRSYKEALRHSPQFQLRDDGASKKVNRLLSDKSINLHLQYFSGLLRWATLEELVHGNPAEGINIRKHRQQSEERFAFNDDQLQILLGDLWLDETRSVRSWVPLVALWSGMRQEEICQLRHCDIIKQDDTFCFVITGEAGSVKSKAAERVVPIHPWLIDRGFLNEVWIAAKANTQERLWPELRKTKLGRYSNSLCKWFGRYKRKKGFHDSRYCFHSLRHTFINTMKQQEVPEPVIRQLVGHCLTSAPLGQTKLFS